MSIERIPEDRTRFRKSVVAEARTKLPEHEAKLREHAAKVGDLEAMLIRLEEFGPLGQGAAEGDPTQSYMNALRMKRLATTMLASVYLHTTARFHVDAFAQRLVEFELLCAAYRYIEPDEGRRTRDHFQDGGLSEFFIFHADVVMMLDHTANLWPKEGGLVAELRTAAAKLNQMADDALASFDDEDEPGPEGYGPPSSGEAA